MSQEIVPVEQSTALSLQGSPDYILQEAARAAATLRGIMDMKKKKVMFNGEIYLEYEDWASVGRFYGITARVKSTKIFKETIGEREVVGFEAIADAIIASSGQIISTAEAMCLNDEPNWSRKPLFQLRSMAQTRACAKTLRNVLSWVVVLGGYKPTPAEEMDGVYDQKKQSEQRSIHPPIRYSPVASGSDEAGVNSHAQPPRDDSQALEPNGGASGETPATPPKRRGRAPKEESDRHPDLPQSSVTPMGPRPDGEHAQAWNELSDAFLRFKSSGDESLSDEAWWKSVTHFQKGDKIYESISMGDAEAFYLNTYKKYGKAPNLFSWHRKAKEAFPHLFDKSLEQQVEETF